MIALASAGAIRFEALLKIGVSYEWVGTVIVGFVSILNYWRLYAK